MDWANLTPDSTRLVPSSNYTSGRSGNSIQYIVLHHNAGNLTHQGVYNAFVSNGTSAHYNVDGSGTVCRFVADANTAYHAGNWSANLRSIGIEHCDTSNSSPWTIPDATLESGAHLVAALCVYHDLGRPEYGTNVKFHKDVKSGGTTCPGEIAGSQKDEYFERAQYWYDVMTGNVEAATADDIEEVIEDMKATHIIFLNEDQTAVYIANVLAGTYQCFPNTNALNVRKLMLERAGAKVVEWKDMCAAKSNVVKDEDIAGFGIRIN